MGQPQGSLGESRRSFGAWSPCYGVGRSSELSPKGVMARHPHAPRPLTLASLLAMKWQAGHTGSIFEPARTSGHSRVLRGCREGVVAHPSLAPCHPAALREVAHCRPGLQRLGSDQAQRALSGFHQQTGRGGWQPARTDPRTVGAGGGPGRQVGWAGPRVGMATSCSPGGASGV